MKEVSLSRRQSIHAFTLSGKSVQRMRATFIIVSGNTRTRTTDCCNIFYVYIRMGKGKVASPRDSLNVCLEIFSISSENYIITYAE